MTEAYVFDGVRTPIGRFGGALAPVRADDLAAIPIRALLTRHPKLDPRATDEIVLGCANQAGEDNRNVARMAGLLAGLGETVPGITVNRLCASGLDAVAQGARAIRLGEATQVIAGGVESMTRAPFVMAKATRPFDRQAEIHDTTIGWRFVNPAMATAFGTESMPQTADNVAEDHGIARADQDAYAFRSQTRCAKAMENGHFAEEITPVEITTRKGTTRVDRDEHPRAETTLDALARLKGINGPERSVTAGNAAGVNDGAAALLLGDDALSRHHTPLARIVATASAGVAPRIMGLGPVPATRKVLEIAGLSLDQMDVIELNEAFAAQVLACLRTLGLPDDAGHVNPNGGAIALGHPLGMSGARLVLTAVRELHRRQGRYALCTMCVGVGQGVAMILERV
ncbi:3-oxoadipyl-CoA thiolase [Dinoroseobacter sp. S124A]|uniref:3-oxoadipyl-CoA thiolase n=1 Tax=Dinoroseobacter sp. S124A TaxID=3415128 RepID=UPI003C7CB491